MTIENVELKNGSMVPNVAVTALMVVLDDLIENKPMVFYDLVMIARNSTYKPFGNELSERGLVDSQGKLHNITRDVVLSAVTGEGIHMTLGNPYKVNNNDNS